MLAETIKLLEKSSERLVRRDNDLKEVTKSFTNLKIPKNVHISFRNMVGRRIKKKNP